jgi:hypothetical protein
MNRNYWYFWGQAFSIKKSKKNFRGELIKVVFLIGIVKLC